MVGFIAVICGLKSEAAVVRASAPAEKARIAVSGANAARAEELTRVLCAEGAAAVVSVGVSGGLSPDLLPGDLLIGSVVKTQSGEEFAASPLLLDACALESDTILMRRAALFGADEIIMSAEEKKRLFTAYLAAAVDMESHGAARAARSAGVPFIAIRAIADPAGRVLPKAALGAVAPDGSTRVFATLAAAMRDPKQFPELMKLGADSAAATKTLRRDLGLLFRRLLLSLDL